MVNCFNVETTEKTNKIEITDTTYTFKYAYQFPDDKPNWLYLILYQNGIPLLKEGFKTINDLNNKTYLILHLKQTLCCDGYMSFHRNDAKDEEDDLDIFDPELNFLKSTKLLNLNFKKKITNEGGRFTKYKETIYINFPSKIVRDSETTRLQALYFKLATITCANSLSQCPPLKF